MPADDSITDTNIDIDAIISDTQRKDQEFRLWLKTSREITKRRERRMGLSFLLSLVWFSCATAAHYISAWEWGLSVIPFIVYTAWSLRRSSQEQRRLAEKSGP